MTATQHIEKKSRFNAPARFSILIPSWNNLDYLKLCVDSIRKNSHFSHQVVVHANQASDGTLEWLDRQSDLDYSFCAQNIGICYGLNIARQLARADYLVYMNDDMYVCPGWDLALFEEISRLNSNYFFFSSTAIEPTFSGNPCAIVMDCGKDIGSFQEARLLEQFQSPTLADWQGSTWPPNVLHKDLWDLVGGYSTEFSPGMYSDPDFSMKLWKAGLRLFRGISSSRVYHFGSKSTGRLKPSRGYYQFIAKWGMTSGTFSTHFLKRGTHFDGPLSEAEIPGPLRLKDYVKGIESIFRL